MTLETPFLFNAPAEEARLARAAEVQSAERAVEDCDAIVRALERTDFAPGGETEAPMRDAKSALADASARLTKALANANGRSRQVQIDRRRDAELGGELLAAIPGDHEKIGPVVSPELEASLVLAVRHLVALGPALIRRAEQHAQLDVIELNLRKHLGLPCAGLEVGRGRLDAAYQHVRSLFLALAHELAGGPPTGLLRLLGMLLGDTNAAFRSTHDVTPDATARAWELLARPVDQVVEAVAPDAPGPLDAVREAQRKIAAELDEWAAGPVGVGVQTAAPSTPVHVPRTMGGRVRGALAEVARVAAASLAGSKS